jgi:hypothetical protein
VGHVNFLSSISCLVNCWALKTEATCLSKTLVVFQRTILSYIPDLHENRCESFKSYGTSFDLDQHVGYAFVHLSHACYMFLQSFMILIIFLLSFFKTSGPRYCLMNNLFDRERKEHQVMFPDPDRYLSIVWIRQKEFEMSAILSYFVFFEIFY